MTGIVLASLALISCQSEQPAVTGNYNVVPLPQEIIGSEAEGFIIDDNTSIAYSGNDVMKRNAEFLAEYIKECTGLELEITEGNAGNAISLAVEDLGENSEAYRLTVDSKGVKITGDSPAGVFYGIQTLRKSLPVDA